MKRASSYLLAAALVLASLAAAAPAAAQDAAAAREHYQKGTTFYDLGRYDDAIKEFEAAYQIKNDPALLYNLAQSHRLAGHDEQALHFYRTYLRRVPNAKNRTEIEGRIAALEQLVAQKAATQTAPPNQTLPPGGGGSGGSGGSSGSTGPDTSGSGNTGGGQVYGPPPPPPPPNYTNGTTAGGTGPGPGPGPGPEGTVTAPLTTPGPRDPGKGLKIAGFAGMGVGAVLVVVGFIEGGRAVSAANEVNMEAQNGEVFNPAVEERGKSAQRAEIVLLVSGAVVGAAGAGLYFYGRKRTAEHAAAPPTTMVAPTASAHGAGAMLRMTF
jgi:tetratricopeptide (TPR) repeat protein